MADFEKAFKALMEDEVGATLNGGYNNRKSDRGGETKYGISKRQYPDEDIKGLNEHRARFLYRRDFWDRFSGDDLFSQAVADILLDICANNGLGAGCRMAQAAAGISPVDGAIGSQSVLALNSMASTWKEEAFFWKLALVRIDRYTKICAKNPSQKVNLLGWVRRALKDCGIKM